MLAASLMFVVAGSAACPPQAPQPVAPPAAVDPFAALAALPAQPATERGVRAVVRDATGAAAVDALLVVVATGPQYTDAWTPAAAAFPGDAIAQAGFVCAAAGAMRIALDERGATTLPRTSGYALAWQDGAFAAKSYSYEEGQPPPRVDLALAAPYACTVEVVDAAGLPAAGVPLGLASGSSTSPRHTTDAAGRVTFRTFAARVTDQTTVRLLIAAKERIEGKPPANGGTARVQLPECGRVHATFTGAVLPGSTLRWSLRQGNRSVTPTATGDRDATFAYVQAGFEGELQVTADSSTTTIQVQGVTAGVTTELAPARKAGERCVVVRLLDPDGAIVRKGYVETNWTYQNGSSSSGAYANTEGWLEVAVPERTSQAKLRLTLHRGSWATPIVGTAEFEITDADQGRIDRGERKVARPAVMLAGEVADTAGRPLRGIRLQTHADTWTTVETDAAGRFEFALPGNKPAELNVTLQGEGWFFTDPAGKARAFPTGTPARIVLQPAGRVRFAAAGLRGELHLAFGIRLEPASGDAQRVEVSLQFGREHLLLPAGHWDVVVTCNDAEVHRLDNLRVDAGIEVHDPRFMAFEWQDFASLVTVHVEDAEGKPCDDCTVWLQHGGGGYGRAPTGGKVQSLLRKDVGTVHVEPRDKKLGKVELGAVSGDQYVRLGGGARLGLRLVPAPKLPAGAQLLARVGGRAEPVPIDGEGKAVVWIPTAGDCAVQLVLRAQGADHALPDAQRSCAVAVGGSELSFPVTAALQAAIDARGGR